MDGKYVPLVDLCELQSLSLSTLLPRNTENVICSIQYTFADLVFLLIYLQRKLSGHNLFINTPRESHRTTKNIKVQVN